MSKDTIFSKIIRKEIPARIVYENSDVLAFHDVAPQAPVHILVIPKKYIPSVSDASDADGEILGKLLLAARDVAKQEGLQGTGYRLIINTGESAGQTVFHLHVHLMAGRPFSWPPG